MTSRRASTEGKDAKRGQQRDIPWFPLAVLVILVLGAVAIALAGGDDEAVDDGVNTAPVAVTGDPLPPFGGDPQNDPAVGSPAPSLEGQGMDGSPITIDPQASGPMALVFLAHWCPHCQVEVTRVQEWLDSNEPPAGVTLRAVSTLVEPSQANYPPSAWLQREGWSVPTLADDEASAAAEAFGLQGTPFWVFVDDRGEVRMRHAGELEIGPLESILEDLTG